jgi:hypothetical protein
MSERRGIFDFTLDDDDDGVENTYMPDADSDSESSGWDSPDEFPEIPEIQQRRFDGMDIDPIVVTVSNRPGDDNPVVGNPYTYDTQYNDSDQEDSDSHSESESILINAIKDISIPLIDSFTDEEEFDKAVKAIPKKDYAKLINDVVSVYVNERDKYPEETKKEIENDFKTIIVPTISRIISPIIIDIFLNSSKMYSLEGKKKEIDLVLKDYFFQNETTVFEVKKSQNDLINWLLDEWKKFQESPELEKIIENEKDLSTRKAKYFEEDIEADDEYYITVNDCLINDDCYMFISGIIILSYSRNQIKKWIRDYLTTWRYWCLQKTLVELRKELGLPESEDINPNDRVLEVRKDSFTYINIPISPSYETVLVPLHKLFSILHNYNNRILYPIFIKTLDATSNFENLYAVSDRSIVSSNHCQNGTQSHLYDLKICNGGDCHIFGSRENKRRK